MLIFFSIDYIFFTILILLIFVSIDYSGHWPDKKKKHQTKYIFKVKLGKEKR